MLPTGTPNITVKGIEVTCLDISMPIVMAKATDFGISGNETSNELNKNLELLNKIEEIRVIAGAQMGLGCKWKGNTKICSSIKTTKWWDYYV